MNLDRITHDVQQGTEQWLRLREQSDGTASEAPAALGVGLYTSRAELLRTKHTGVAPDHGPAALALFRAGHDAEARARPLAEGVVNEELFPVTMSVKIAGLTLLASMDGLTLDERLAWETKLWNEVLAAHVRAGTLPEHYLVQMDQQMLVSGAERCLFTVTDGTPERFVSCWHEASQERFDALVSGWLQFHKDLASYVPPAAAEPAPVGKAPESLPALHIEVTGEVTASNLAEFKATALGAIRAVNRDLKTDQDFADAAKAVQWCTDVEVRLKAAKEHALSQTATIDALFKTIDDISAEARTVRLDLAKLVDRRKTEVKEGAVANARKALDQHIADLNGELAPMRLQPVAADFAGAIKGLRSIASMQDALDTALANGKIAADAQARQIRTNVATFKGAAAGLEFLFADLGQIVHKAADDFAVLVSARITTHRAAEAERERKRKADEEARIAAEAKRLADEAIRQAEAKRQAEELAAHVAEAAKAEALAAESRFRLAAQTASNTPVPDSQQVLKAEAARPDATDREQPAIVSLRGGAVGAGKAAAAAPVAEPATLKLGDICNRLGFTMSAAFLADVLRVKPARTDGRSLFYTESQYLTICRQLQSHVGAMAEMYAGEPA